MGKCDRHLLQYISSYQLSRSVEKALCVPKLPATLTFPSVVSLATLVCTHHMFFRAPSQQKHENRSFVHLFAHAMLLRSPCRKCSSQRRNKRNFRVSEHDAKKDERSSCPTRFINDTASRQRAFLGCSCIAVKAKHASEEIFPGNSGKN